MTLPISLRHNKLKSYKTHLVFTTKTAYLHNIIILLNIILHTSMVFFMAVLNTIWKKVLLRSISWQNNLFKELIYFFNSQFHKNNGIFFNLKKKKNNLHHFYN